MSQGQLLLKQWGPFAAIVIAIIILIIIVMVAKSLAPVKVVMEVVGKGRSKPVSMSIGKKVDFGSKAGLKFLLDHAAFKDVVGTLERKGKKEWKITPRDSSVFDDTKKLDHYKMRDTFKLKTRDGSFVSVKFNIKK